MCAKLVNAEFRVMQSFMALIDKFSSKVRDEAEAFGIQPGMTVVDYGCGPGRYTVEFARSVGSEGKVFAVDLLAVALEATQKRLLKHSLRNVEFKLAQGYNSRVPEMIADIVFAIDMIHHVESKAFLTETYRITKPNGLLIISGGHQPRSVTKQGITASGLWTLREENSLSLICSKINPAVS